METANFADKIDLAIKSGKQKVYFDLMGTDKFRCGLNVYMPGSGTDGLHYHNTDETFTVVEGKGEIVHRDGSRTAIEKGMVLLIPAKSYYDIKNNSDGVLAVLGNRGEGFGGATVYLDPEFNNKKRGSAARI
ncbi:MAG: cupin domain-containing protein [Candidatus Binatia bacterium]